MANTLMDAIKLWPVWQAAAKDPEAAQATSWEATRGLLAQGTFWPGVWGASEAPPLEAFAPSTYDVYAQAIETAFAEGTVSPLNAEPIVAWVESSGTSGKARRFPWTPSYKKQYVDGSSLPLPVMEPMARLRGRAGNHLAMTSSKPSRFSPTGIPIGYATAFTAANDGSVYPDEANSSPERIQWWRSCYALATPLRSIMATTCEPIFRMLQQFDEHSDHYRAVIDGSKPLPDGLRPLVLPDERRAYLLDRLGHGPLGLLDVWPDLAFVHSWRAGPAGLQAQRLQASTGDRVRFIDLCYNASEGPIANPISIDAIGGPIFAAGVIHEFLPQGAEGRADEVLKAWELEEGGVYEVLITSAMGLVRYRLGDLVACTGHFHRVPTLRYHRRVRAELSLGLSVFSEDELVRVLERAPLPPDVEAVFGPSADGRSLVLYTSREVPQATLDAMHAALLEWNETYAGMFKHSWMQALQQVAAPGDPLWERIRPKHAQAKPPLLLQTPPTLASEVPS